MRFSGAFHVTLCAYFSSGTIRDFSLLSGISSGSKFPEADRAAGLTWKHFPATPVKEFFDGYMKEHSSLERMPIQFKDGAAGGDILNQNQLGTASKDPEVGHLRCIDVEGFIDCLRSSGRSTWNMAGTLRTSAKRTAGRH